MMPASIVAQNSLSSGVLVPKINRMMRVTMTVGKKKAMSWPNLRA